MLYKWQSLVLKDGYYIVNLSFTSYRDEYDYRYRITIIENKNWHDQTFSHYQIGEIIYGQYIKKVFDAFFVPLWDPNDILKAIL